MARKKSRRPNLPEQTLAKAKSELYGNGVSQPAGVAASSSGAAARPANRSAVSIEDLKVEYAYVINDLRSMALLAGLLIVALVAASKILL